VLDETFESIDGDALLASALDRRLRGRSIADESEFSRLYRYLLTQGFESDRIRSILEKRRT